MGAFFAFGEKQLYNFLKQKHKLINELDCDMNPPEDKINNGESFEAVQEAYGLPGSHEIGLYSVGDVDPIPETVCTLSDNIQIAVMGLAVNEISEPIEIEIHGSHSWVIMKRLP